MQIRPIETDGDYAAALREIERLWGSPIGTADGGWLDILVTLVEKYEEARWPITDDSGPIE